MTTQKAVIITEPKKIGLVTDRPIPALQDDYILVRTVSVGLNPTDWKHVAFLSPLPGVLVGCDYAGIVEAIGKDIKKPFKKGNCVCGFTHGANAVQPEDGAFAETKNNLKLALDYISLEASAKFCNKAIFSEGGEYSTLLDMKIEYTNVNNCFTLAYTTAGEAFNFGNIQFLAKLEDQAHSKKFIMIAESLLSEGKVKVHPPMVGKGGLKDVIEELQLLKEDKVSKEKLVYNIAKTLNI
ncbi:hypothetical protein ETB97_004584 [Aspergillus alliaceus]|uniref:Alcohol dehydrogenase-like N-terminal domain-containing protein n=1 Tax=Petromyces alliaceus TaxID=209559 RepID=A0A8H6A1D4_PETAA|nr:hypothetical protein ETB97_004584 [Aspergillus burnettii]